ncbi:hypothetical protein [Streptomyces sp. 8N706]|uniref:hypothetical protein n=1 Tax=Streptomyces sp. 8N706 TaxID=3457416 RepID=UPI003FCF5CA7
MSRDVRPRPSESAAASVCPECGRPVDTVIVGRRKALGVFVPVWGPGPCHNPACPRYAGFRPETPQRDRTAAPPEDPAGSREAAEDPAGRE